MAPAEAQKMLILSGRIISFLMFLPLLVMLYRIRWFSRPPYLFLLIGRLITILVNLFVVWILAFTSVPENYQKIKPLLNRYEIDDTFFVDPILYLETFICIGLFLYYHSVPRKRAVLYVSSACVLFTLINTFWGETYKDFQSTGSMVNNLYIVAAGALLIKTIFESNLNRKLTRIPEFYFAFAFIISGAVCGLLDFLSNHMFKESPVLFYQLHTIKNVLFAVSFLISTYGAYLVRQKTRLAREAAAIDFTG